MIPIRDTIRAQNFPAVNILLILLNVVIFLFEVSLGPRALDRLILTYGLVPAHFWATKGVAEWLPIFTSMFLHGGWLHIISNMLALYIFGDNVEDRLGHWRYLTFYLLGGTLAALAHLLAYRTSEVPTIGASGAIAAVLGAYLVLYPRARVLTLIPIFIIFPIIEVPAVVFLGFWFLWSPACRR
jgi:membrane associated rhomboid family serine protease